MSSNIGHEVVIGIQKAIEPLVIALESHYAFRYFLRNFGWDIDTIDESDVEQLQSFFNLTQLIEAMGDEIIRLQEESEDQSDAIISLLATGLEAISVIGELATKDRSGLPPPLDSNDFWDDFPKELIDYLLINALKEDLPVVEGILRYIGVFEISSATPSGSFRISYDKHQVDWSKLGEFLTDPLNEILDHYQWDTSSFKYDKLQKTTANLFESFSLPVRFEDPPATSLDEYYSPTNPARSTVKSLYLPLYLFLGNFEDTFVETGFKAMPIPPQGNKNGSPEGFMIGPVVRGNASPSFEIGDGVSLYIKGGFETEDNIRMNVWPDGVEFVADPSATSFDAEIGIIGKKDEPYILIGEQKSHRVELDGFKVSLQGKGAVTDPEVIFLAGTNNEEQPSKLKIIIQAKEGDGFLNSIIGTEPITIDFGGEIFYSSKSGLGINGNVGFSIMLPLHLDLAIFAINSLLVEAAAGNDGNSFISLGAQFDVTLGPIAGVVENMGVKLEFVNKEGTGESGILGNLDLEWGFKPPNGVGLSVDAGPVKGGGYLYFDFDREEYAGALELVFSDWIALRAIGLITTKMPDGSKGFSMLIIITVEFGTGIQLGFGFTLLGVGGLLGINRIVNIEPLKDGIRTGAVESVMFPQDVIANAPKIISDLRKFFPPQEDLFLIGPMAKIGWGTPTLISVSIGIIMEIPSINITILGVVKVVLPDEEADILRLQVNFIGRIEPSNERLWFYAELFDSRVLFITLEGGMGLLVGWGDNANFVVSVGGFHPRYSPPPLPFPEPPRIAVSILNESYAKVRIEAYFAVTSNSVQFGARAELFFGVSEFKIEGFLAFDALFQFDPFFFSFGLSISLSVKVFGIGLFSVGFSGILEGPTPWYIEGKGKISLLFFKIKVPFSHTWGQEEDTKLDPIEVFPLIEKELNALTNWVARIPESSNILVSLRKLGDSEEDQLVLHPVGTLRISQRKIPLDFKMDKVGNQVPSDVNKLQIAASINGDDLAVSEIEEKFAIGQFKDLDDSKRLSSPAFEPLDGGVELAVEGEQIKTSQAVKRVIRYESIIIDNYYKRFVKPFFEFFVNGFTGLYEFLFEHFMAGNAVTKSELSYHHKKRMQPFDEVIQVKPHEYSVAFNTNNKPMDGEATSFTSQARATQFMEQKIQDDPKLADELHVIPNTEINTAA